MAKDGTFEPAFIRLKQKIRKEPSVPHVISSPRALLDLKQSFPVLGADLNHMGIF